MTIAAGHTGLLLSPALTLRLANCLCDWQQSVPVPPLGHVLVHVLEWSAHRKLLHPLQGEKKMLGYFDKIFQLDMSLLWHQAMHVHRATECVITHVL